MKEVVTHTCGTCGGSHAGKPRWVKVKNRANWRYELEREGRHSQPPTSESPVSRDVDEIVRALVYDEGPGPLAV